MVHVQIAVPVDYESVTLDTPFKEGFASFTGPDTIMVARGIVTAHSAEVHVCFAPRGTEVLITLHRPFPRGFAEVQGGNKSEKTLLHYYFKPSV